MAGAVVTWVIVGAQRPTVLGGLPSCNAVTVQQAFADALHRDLILGLVFEDIDVQQLRTVRQVDYDRTYDIRTCTARLDAVYTPIVDLGGLLTPFRSIDPIGYTIEWDDPRARTLYVSVWVE